VVARFKTFLDVTPGGRPRRGEARPGPNNPSTTPAIYAGMSCNQRSRVALGSATTGRIRPVGFLAGAIEFLTKPLDPPKLLTTIQTAFEMDRARRNASAVLEGLRRRHAQLSPREREVLPLVVSGMRNKQAAWTLGIAEVTLQVHRRQIMRKLSARSFAELIRMSSLLGIHY
jgi:DNA-binding CsgD family transcriptional regulator